jgi:hypothetical protein
MNRERPPPSRRRRRAALPRRQRGAALLLLLLVLGLGASSLLMSLFSPPSGELRPQALTRESLAQAREALLGYAVAHRRLPRPALSATDGRENPRPCASDADCTGFLPWITLGLVPGDGWNKLLRYSVSRDFANGNLDAPVEADKTVFDRHPDGTVFYRVGTANCRVDDRCAPAVIYSSGKHLGVSVDGIAQLSGVTDNLDEQANEAAVREFMARAASGEPHGIGGSFSNVVSWVPLPLIRNRVRATAPSADRPPAPTL